MWPTARELDALLTSPDLATVRRGIAALSSVDQAVVDAMNTDAIQVLHAAELVTLVEFSPLERLNVRQLTLADCPSLVSLQGVEALRQLESLEVDDCPRITNIGVVSHLKSLQALVVRACPDIEDFLDIVRPAEAFVRATPLQALSVLVLEDCTELSELDFLEGMHEGVRTALHVGMVSGDDLAEYGIRPLTRLRELSFAGCTFLQDIRALTQLPAVEVLNLGNCHNVDISPLAGMQNLRWLELGGAHQGGGLALGPLRRLSRLEFLGLAGMCVADLNDLRGLHCLRSLDLKFNHGLDLRPLAQLPALREVDIYGCEDLRHLASIAKPDLTILQSDPDFR